MATTEKKQKLLTPIGEAKWTFLSTPKAPFKDKYGREKGSPSYQISVTFEQADPKWGPWAKRIFDIVNALPVQADDMNRKLSKHLPFKKEKDKDGKLTGLLIATFKTGEKYRPGVFYKKSPANPTGALDPSVKIGNGSKVIVSYTENTYDTFGGGMNLYLSGVQIIELVEYQSQSAESYGFQLEDVPQDDGGTDFNFGANAPATGQGFNSAQNVPIGKDGGIGDDGMAF